MKRRVKRLNPSPAPRVLSTDSQTDVTAKQWRRGEVTRIENDWVSVALLPQLGCAGCQKAQKMGTGPGHCGIDLLGLAKTSQPVVVRVSLSESHQAIGSSDANRQNALKVGDPVDVQINAASDAWVALVLRVYGVPTAGLLAGAALGGAFNEFGSLLLGLLGLCAGLWFSRRSVHIPTSLLTLTGPHQPTLRIVNRVIDTRS